MTEFVIPSQKIEDKLAKRGITLDHCIECFANRTGGFPRDTRERHQTDPPTRWFISRTDAGRLLKVIFIHYQFANEIHIKSAYEPNTNEIELYNASE
jgi:uncharacterized DUF497 family protein